MGNTKGYKKLFISARCSWCGIKENFTTMAVVEDKVQKFKLCQTCFNKFNADYKLPKWDKLENY